LSSDFSSLGLKSLILLFLSLGFVLFRVISPFL
jgi:hypothetical protein